MSDNKYNPSHIKPSEFMVLVGINDQEELVEYIDDGIVSYHVDNGDIYFTEQDAIDYLCPDDYWDPGDKPDSIRELKEYSTINSEWDSIVNKAEELDVNLDFLNEDEGQEGSNELNLEHYRICAICDHKVIYSKGLCKRHYNKIYYKFGEINKQTITAFKEQEEGQEDWSKDYKKCQRCHTTDNEHHARGYCKRCYYKEYHQTDKKAKV